METEPEGLLAAKLPVWPILDRPVCLPFEHSDDLVLQLETRPTGDSGGRSGPSLEQGTSICVSPESA